jgi:hypothetical protein
MVESPPRKSDYYRSFYYVAPGSGFPLRHTDRGAGRHINSSATLRIKCGRPHLMREFCTSGSVRDEGGNILIYSATRKSGQHRIPAFANGVSPVPLQPRSR